ncbi:MAG: hypothetical protein WD847_06895 [Pirellulales bacterium]
MNATMPGLLAANQFQRFRELLRLLAALRDISEPLTTPEGLKKAIATLLELAVFLGLDRELVERIRSILSDDASSSSCWPSSAIWPACCGWRARRATAGCG